MTNAASAGQTAVWTILTIGSYLWIVLWIARRLGDASDQLEESQERIRVLKNQRIDLDVADYVDALGQHPVREFDEQSFSLDFPHDNAVESPDTGRAA